MKITEKLRGLFKDPTMAQEFIDTTVALEKEFFVPGIRAVIREEQAKYELRLALLEKENGDLRRRLFRIEQAMSFKAQLIISQMLEDLPKPEDKP